MRNERGVSLVETLVVLAVLGTIAGVAVPAVSKAIENFRVSGDARSVSNAVALTKMRAAANFSQVRLYVDLAGRSHHLETWDKTTSKWVAEGGNTLLSTGVIFGSGSASNPPPNTQGTIGQAPKCRTDAGNDVANTACVVFNSRGIPVDPITGSPIGLDALYVTDGGSVYSVTVSATGMIRNWRGGPQSTVSWVLQ